MGLGAGWQGEEYRANGYPFPSNAERIDQLAEGIKVLKAMWTQEEPTYQGRYFSIDKAYNFPKPVQKPHPPVMVGGSGKRVLKVAAAEADIVNFSPPIPKGEIVADAFIKFDKTELSRRIELLRNYAYAAGRKPEAIEISAFSFVVTAEGQHEVDAQLSQMAATLGIKDVDAMRRVPYFLVGTPEELRREIHSRIDEFAMTYFVLQFASLEAADLFGRKVLPEFG